MLILLGMSAGIALGHLLRRQKRFLHVANITTTGLVYLLLFLLGISVGGNEAILGALDELGLQALLLSGGAIGGSVLLAAPLGARLFSQEGGDEK